MVAINSKRIFFVMIAVIVLLCFAALGLTFTGDKLLQKQSAKLLEAKLNNKVNENEQLSLAAAKKDIEKYAELGDIAKKIVPSDKDQAKTTREIVAIAEDLGITIAQIGFPTSDLGNKKPVAVTTEGEKPAAQVSNSISQAKPVTDIPGLLQLDINVVADSTYPVSYNQLISFLQKLENNRRTSQVTALNIQPDTKDHSLLSFSLTVTVYIKP